MEDKPQNPFGQKISYMYYPFEKDQRLGMGFNSELPLGKGFMPSPFMDYKESDFDLDAKTAKTNYKEAKITNVDSLTNQLDFSFGLNFKGWGVDAKAELTI